MEDIYENLIFIGMDFVNEPKRLLKQIESKICREMTPDEFQVYKYGVDTVLNLIAGIVTHDPNDIFVHINGLKHQEEFVLDELLERMRT